MRWRTAEKVCQAQSHVKRNCKYHDIIVRKLIGKVRSGKRPLLGAFLIPPVLLVVLIDRVRMYSTLEQKSPHCGPLAAKPGKPERRGEQNRERSSKPTNVDW